jgi:hypothetical protein
VRSCFDYKLIPDAIASVQFHPFKPLVMTSAGSRVISPQRDESDSDSDDSGSDGEEEESDDEIESADQASLSGRPTVTKGRRPLDDTLRIWTFA